MHIIEFQALKALKTLGFTNVQNVQNLHKLFLKRFLKKFYIKMHKMHIFKMISLQIRRESLSFYVK